MLKVGVRTDTGKGYFERLWMPEKDYGRLCTISDEVFDPAHRGQFGIDEKVQILNPNMSVAFVWDLRCLLSDVRKRLEAQINEKRKRLEDPSARVKEYKDFGKPCLEAMKGVFTTPQQELNLDRIVREIINEEAKSRILAALYTGRELLHGTRAYGHHLHWSAGGMLDTLLLYDALQAHLWRITAFSANSPRITEDGKVIAMCDRLGKTYVKKLVPPFLEIYPKQLRRIMKNGYDTHEYKVHPLLIHKSTGTVEVRASDIDPRSSATIAYIVIIISALSRKIEQAHELDFYSDGLLLSNFNTAKRYAVSNEGVVWQYEDGNLKRVPLQQEMIRHWETELEPELERLQKLHHGRYMPQCLINEIKARIYQGLTPAMRQVNAYKRGIEEHGRHTQALLAAQRCNLFIPENYFPLN